MSSWRHGLEGIRQTVSRRLPGHLARRWYCSQSMYICKMTLELFMICLRQLATQDSDGNGSDYLQTAKEDSSSRMNANRIKKKEVYVFMFVCVTYAAQQPSTITRNGLDIQCRRGHRRLDAAPPTRTRRPDHSTGLPALSFSEPFPLHLVPFFPLDINRPGLQAESGARDQSFI